MPKKFTLLKSETRDYYNPITGKYDKFSLVAADVITPEPAMLLEFSSPENLIAARVRFRLADYYTMYQDHTQEEVIKQCFNLLQEVIELLFLNELPYRSKTIREIFIEIIEHGALDNKLGILDEAPDYFDVEE